MSDRPTDLGAPAAPGVLADTERALGFALYPLHSQLLATIGNGGFGPGHGLVGTVHGVPDADGRTLLELRAHLGLDSETTLPNPVVPLCDWGDCIWSCLDSGSGQVLTLDEFGLKDTGLKFDEWLFTWSQGTSLWEQIAVFEDRVVIDPFTKQNKSIKLVIGTRGTPYRTKPDA